MSDNFKKIRRTKVVIRELLSKGWSMNAISVESGLSPNLTKDILQIDPVSIGIRQSSAEKIDRFLEKHEGGHHPPPEKSKRGPRKVGKKDEFEIQVQPSMIEAVPPSTDMVITPAGLLNELVHLSTKFKKAGFKMDVNISFDYGD